MHYSFKRQWIKPIHMLLIAAILLVLLWGSRSCTGKSSSNKQSEVPITDDSVHSITIPLYHKSTGAVEQILLEQYVLQTVAAEMPASFDMEALMAQAVLARTLVIQKMEHTYSKEHPSAPICDDYSHCQAFITLEEMRENWGYKYDENYEKIKSAVISTIGEIVTYDGVAIQVLYHSTSGGYTEDSQNVFSAAMPYLVSVESPGEESATHYNDTIVFDRDELADKLNKKINDANLNSQTLETQLNINSRFTSGRVEFMQVGSMIIEGKTFRYALDLPSANFTISYDKNNVIINTSGFGHGVGMSQLGANAMAKTGDNYKKILSHYYTGTIVEQIS